MMSRINGLKRIPVFEFLFLAFELNNVFMTVSLPYQIYTIININTNHLRYRHGHENTLKEWRRFHY
jgi:hypothetical protein